MKWLKQPDVYAYKKRFVVKGDFEHEGIAYERKSTSLRRYFSHRGIALPLPVRRPHMARTGG